MRDLAGPATATLDLADHRAARATRAGEILFWLGTVALVAFVALCAGHRDVLGKADAWEHLRAVEALSLDWHPGNPTFATPEPSVRYSPYFLAQAAIVRSLHADAYRVLSWAAVLNTLLLCVGLRVLLWAWGECRAAPLALLAMVALWGVAPQYAGTTALADLPWHMVNPSAFSFATALFALAAVRRWSIGGPAWLWAFAVPIAVCAMLDHGMTGAFVLLAILITVATSPRRNVGGALSIGLGVVVLAACALWPWYPFLKVVRAKHDVGYWLNIGVMQQMLGHWCAPAILLSLATLATWHRPLVRTFCLIGWAAFAFTLASLPLRSPAFARFMMPGTFFLQVAIAVWATHVGATTFAGWRDAIASMARRSERAAPATLLAFFAIAMAYGLVPQLIDAVREPHLARPLLAKLVHARDLQRPLRPIYGELLAGVAPRDVVMADELTGWPISGVHGRLVSALHWERLTLDQPQREADVARFFAAATDAAARRELLAKYGARWILLDLATQPAAVTDPLRAAYAERRRVGDLVLLEVK